MKYGLPKRDLDFNSLILKRFSSNSYHIEPESVLIRDSPLTCNDLSDCVIQRGNLIHRLGGMQIAITTESDNKYLLARGNVMKSSNHHGWIREDAKEPETKDSRSRSYNLIRDQSGAALLVALFMLVALSFATLYLSAWI